MKMQALQLILQEHTGSYDTIMNNYANKLDILEEIDKSLEIQPTKTE